MDSVLNKTVNQFYMNYCRHSTLANNYGYRSESLYRLHIVTYRKSILYSNIHTTY